MACGKITKRSVDALYPGSGPLFLWDEEIAGFGVKVMPSGSKTYIYQYRLGGRCKPTKRYTIGKHGGLTPTKARLEAERLSFLVAQGRDPAEEKRRRAEEPADVPFSEYVTKFCELHLRPCWRSHKNAEGSIRLHALPLLGRMRLSDIHRQDVQRVLDSVSTKTATRKNLHTVLRRLFNWAVARGDLESSPLAKLEVPPAPKSRDVVLTDLEIAAFWSATSRLGYPFGPFFRLLLLTGKRREEVAAMRWEELCFEDRLWTIPGPRAEKNQIADLVPVSSTALRELNSIAARGDKRVWPASGFVFTTRGKSPISGYSRAKARLDRLLQDELQRACNWRTHDLRRTLATGLQRQGERLEVTEAVLNHVSGSKSGIVGIYQRHDWKREKRIALERWGAQVERVARSRLGQSGSSGA